MSGSTCKRLPQLYSSEPDWKLVDSYSLQKVVERVYKAKKETVYIGEDRRSRFVLCCESEYCLVYAVSEEGFKWDRGLLG